MPDLVSTAGETGIRAATPPLSLLDLEPGRAATGDPYRIYLDSLDSESSRATMRGCLDRIARIILTEENGAPLPQNPKITGECRTWWRLRYAHTARLRSRLLAEPTWSYQTVNKHLIALRRVLKECWRLGLMTAEEYQRAADIKSVEGSREKTGRDINDNELTSMFQVCEEGDGPAPVRNAALIGVLYCTGIRRAEAATALIERYNPGERGLRIIGKRNKERTVYIIEEVVPRLDRWLGLLGRKGSLFRPVDRWGNIRSEGMTPTAIGDIVKRVRQQAGLPPLSTHDFRRNYTGELLDRGVDLSHAQKLLGHASPVTTASYDRRPERLLRDAADRITLPSSESLRDAEPLPQEASET
jgi:site-specific recombinase XerD